MNRKLYCMIALSVLMGCGSDKTETNTVPCGTVDGETAAVKVLVTTSAGEFALQLDLLNTPITSANFLRYLNVGFYDGTDGFDATTFHYVDRDFGIKGGGFTADGTYKTAFAPIENEAAISGLSNLRGTIAMARAEDPNSATSEFYINLMDNTYLDAGEYTEAGYAVFGFVSSGLDVVEDIADLPVDVNNQPLEPVVIQSMACIPIIENPEEAY